MTAARDTIGRRNRRHPISTGKRLRLTDRDMLWLKALQEHGPLSSSFLLQFGEDTHKNTKRAKERLTDLFNEDNTEHGGPYLMRPPQQFRTLDARYNQLVYDIAPAGWKALEVDRPARAGPWLHSFMVSSITASIDLAASARPDITYLSQSMLLARAEAELRCTVTIAEPGTGRSLRKDIIPDALFGLQYDTPDGSRYRCFLVEADRATEPATSRNFNRKSWLRSLLQYQEYVGRGLYHTHLSLKAPLLVLIVLTDERRKQQIMRLVAKHTPDLAPYLLFQSWEDFGPVFRPPKPNKALLNARWERAEQDSVRIDRTS